MAKNYRALHPGANQQPAAPSLLERAITKIGLLTLDVDTLRLRCNQQQQRIEQLEAANSELSQQLAASAESADESAAPTEA